MKLKRTESVLVLIYDHQGQVLVMQRKDDPEFWQSVTGTLEANELPIETAIREVREETGIDIVVAGFEIIDTRVVEHKRYAHNGVTNIPRCICQHRACILRLCRQRPTRHPNGTY